MDTNLFEDVIKGLLEAEDINNRVTVPTVRYKIPEVNLRHCREVLRMTQADFAEFLGIRLKTLQLMEKGRRRPPAAVLALCRVIAFAPDVVVDALNRPFEAELYVENCDPRPVQIAKFDLE